MNKICKTVPLEGSEEDRMLQAHELKLNPNNENYPHDVIHVYAQNAHCGEWNEYRLKLLPGKEFTNIATDSKKGWLYWTSKCYNAYKSMWNRKSEKKFCL